MTTSVSSSSTGCPGRPRRLEQAAEPLLGPFPLGQRAHQPGAHLRVAADQPGEPGLLRWYAPARLAQQCQLGELPAVT
jgi:hypothetical protein